MKRQGSNLTVGEKVKVEKLQVYETWQMGTTSVFGGNGWRAKMSCLHLPFSLMTLFCYKAEDIPVGFFSKIP